MSESADSLREWLSVASVEAEQGSPGSGHAHSGVEKFSRRYTALHTCADKYFFEESQIFLLLSTCWEAHSGSWKRCWLCGKTWYRVAFSLAAASWPACRAARAWYDTGCGANNIFIHPAIHLNYTFNILV